MLTTHLLALGLTKTQAAVYRHIIKRGKITPSDKIPFSLSSTQLANIIKHLEHEGFLRKVYLSPGKYHYIPFATNRIQNYFAQVNMKLKQYVDLLEDPTNEANIRFVLADQELTSDKIDLYFDLLKNERSVSKYAKAKKTNRNNVYWALKPLEKLGLAKRQKANIRSRIIIMSPLPYRSYLSEQLRDLQADIKNFQQKYLPDFADTTIYDQGAPEIQYFEGEEEVREIFEDMLREQPEEVLSYIPAKGTELFLEGFMNEYMPKFQRAKIDFLTIQSDPNNKNGKIIDPDFPNLITRFISVDKLLINAEKGIYKDKVYIISKVIKFGLKFSYGILIKNKTLAQTERAAFRRWWQLESIFTPQ